MCIEYRTLNKVTVKNKYLIPLTTELFDYLGGTRYFSKLDLHSDYWKIQIVEEDIEKTTYIT